MLDIFLFIRYTKLNKTKETHLKRKEGTVHQKR